MVPDKLVPVIVPDAATLVGVIAPSVNEMAGVVVGLATVPLTPLAVVTDTLFTVPPPPPAGAAHVPSPRQNVVFVAPVPPAKFATERLPVMLEAVPVVFWFKVGMSEGVKAAPLVTRPLES